MLAFSPNGAGIVAKEDPLLKKSSGLAADKNKLVRWRKRYPTGGQYFY